MVRRIAFILCAVLMTACSGVGIPQATPTVAPSLTPSPTPVETSVALVPSRTPIPTTTATNTAAPTSIPSETLQPTLTFTATVTNAPSATPSFTPSLTLTSTDTLTFTPTLTLTATLTNAPSATPTYTPSQTSTPTHTLTPLPTPTLTPTTTASLTWTPIPTSTPLPRLEPTNTPSFTFTPSLTFTNPATSTFTAIPPTRTPLPTRTSLPSQTPNLTQTADFNLRLTPFITFTPRPTSSPTFTLPPPTLNVTPTFITGVAQTPLPQDLALTFTPAPGTDTVETFNITPSPTAGPTVANVNPPPTISIQSFPSSGGDFTSRVYTVGPGGVGASFELGGISNPTLLVQNPRDPNSFIITDALGQLFDITNGATRRASGKMFDTGTPNSPEANNGFVTNAAWSPDGTKAAFIVDSWSVKGREATADDGIWFFTPGQAVTDANQLLIHCPEEGMGACDIIRRTGKPYVFRAVSVVWSPDNQRLLATIQMRDPGEERQVLMVMSLGQDRSQPPPALFYDYGDWSGDGKRVIVSGRDHLNGTVVLGSVVPDGTNRGGEVLIALNGSQQGLWLQNGTQRSDGSLIALGRFGDANGAMRIFDQNGQPLTNDIGFAPPKIVKWNPARDTVFVETTDGRKYLAYVNGAITDITDQVGGIQTVSWVSGQLPPSSGASVDLGAVPSDFIPSGVIEGSRLQPGQQLRVASSTGLLNLRQQPLRDGALLARIFNGSYVAILAGPVNADGVEWWQVQTADGSQGWMAGRIDGFDVLIP